MGLDIYCSKVKPSKGVNVNSIRELDDDRTAQHKKRFNNGVNKLVKRFKQAIADNNSEERSKIIGELYDYIKEKMVYEWYYENITTDKTNDEILDIVKKLKKQYYPQEDVYFRKANFVYSFFQPYLVDEECIVTKDMVNELLEKCNEVIVAAKEDKIISDDDEIDSKYFYRRDYLQLTDKEREKEDKRVKKINADMPTNWVDIAENTLPTQAGFFFGSTEYNIGYLEHILSCKKQFTKLLADWKDDEVVYIIMSW